MYTLSEDDSGSLRITYFGSHIMLTDRQTHAHTYTHGKEHTHTHTNTDGNKKTETHTQFKSKLLSLRQDINFFCKNEYLAVCFIKISQRELLQTNTSNNDKQMKKECERKLQINRYEEKNCLSKIFHLSTEAVITLHFNFHSSHFLLLRETIL